VTGLDLVKLQLDVARGVCLAGQPPAARGHAIEVRLNAEDPWKDFLPQTGTIARLRAPSGVRFDEGIAGGSVVTPHYDSMLAKLVAWGEDREEARLRLVAALGDLHVAGVRTNQAFLRWLLAHPAVSAGPVTTRFLDETPLPAAPAASGLAPPAALAWLAARDAAAVSGGSPWRALGPARLTSQPAPRVVALAHDDGETDVLVSGWAGRYDVAGLGAWRAEYDGETLSLDDGGGTTRCSAWILGDRISLMREGATQEFRIVPRDERFGGQGLADASAAASLVAPFPGLVTEVRVAPGDEVHEGDVVVVIEAMKMLHALPASGHGVVARVHASEGMSVESGTVLVSFETE
jgi:acetyl/propionyl-CoA carboxylase alpha subunit